MFRNTCLRPTAWCQQARPARVPIGRVYSYFGSLKQRSLVDQFRSPGVTIRSCDASLREPTGRTYQIIRNFAEKTFEHEGILEKPVLCIPFPLGEPSRHVRDRSQLMQIYSPAGNISHPCEKLNQTRPRLHIVHYALHMLCSSNDSWVVFRIYWRKMVIYGHHNG